MAKTFQEDCVISISFWDAFTMHFFSFLLGTWVIVKKLFFSFWSAHETPVKDRSQPPTHYTDSSFGTHSYVKVKGVKFHYVESGHAEKPLLLLLHGFPDCWFGWRYQIPLMSKHFRVVALDLKGFGDSDKPIWRRYYHIDSILGELHELIRVLGYSNCVIVGHDLGALIGWYFVHRYPESVEKFVCISCPHPNIFWSELPNSNVFNARWINFCQLPYLPEMEALNSDLQIIDKCYSHLQAKKDSSALDVYKYIFARSEDWSGPINYYRNLPFSRVSPSSEPLTVPVLLITGNKDKFAQLESVVKSAEYIEKHTVKLVDGAGHFPHQEMPEMVNVYLLSFLTVPKAPPKAVVPSPKSGLLNRMFGTVSSTVRYGNHVLDAVQKRTTGAITSGVNQVCVRT